MSKKKFNSGLESLFSEGADQDLEQGKVTLLNVKEKSSGSTNTRAQAKPKPETSTAAPVKSFTSDLDSLFNDVMTETIEEKVESIITEKVKPKRRRVIARKPLSGLDALFRRTVDNSEEEKEVEQVKLERTIKRVSFTFHKDRLLKLKSIAKMEKSYLKDIISEVVSEYIDEYEKKTGTALG